MYCFAENQNISPNGKWIAGKYREESMDENGLITKGTIYPAFYNTETETTTVMRDYPDCTAVGATDDGIGLIAEGTSMQTAVSLWKSRRASTWQLPRLHSGAMGYHGHYRLYLLYPGPATACWYNDDNIGNGSLVHPVQRISPSRKISNQQKTE